MVFFLYLEHKLLIRKIENKKIVRA